MELIDNIHKTFAEDLRSTLTTGSRMSIAASCFSIYAYQELRKELEHIEELRFIFISPTFITDKTNKEQREFYIPRLNRERSLTGSEFEILLRNELTQKAIARECAEWIRRKVKFKSNKTKENMMGFGVVDSTSHTLTLLYSGPDSKIGYFRRWTSSVRLKNGSYRAAASISASNVSNYAGNENLQGGNYSVDCFISTYRR